ncbi:hypothetical protein FA13DRAFT_262730 [Coprinellus micaceus]|uniref:Uncharacterized protein n=1 Tax=Coprinellus micaceus TaxID=71717 RepID=A0A4Y7SF26_COPMI|nr:hypothetical protein FA13DRAFT_262730 [Coprinellus micaceus]
MFRNHGPASYIRTAPWRPPRSQASSRVSGRVHSGLTCGMLCSVTGSRGWMLMGKRRWVRTMLGAHRRQRLVDGGAWIRLMMGLCWVKV